jgi:branched-chain amino acid transport system substrate-binding protein
MRFLKISTGGRGVLARVLLLAASAVMVGACSSGHNQAASVPASSQAGQANQTGQASGAAAAGTVLNYPAYVGGKGKADPALTPVVIGWVNIQGGPPSLDFPQATSAIQGAVKYANAQLGGVDGHPIQLVTCYIASTAQQAQQCGQQFRSNKNMVEVIGGLVAVGNTAFYSAMGSGKLFLGSVGINPADYTAANAFFLSGTNTAAFGPYASYIKAHYPAAEKAAIIYNDNPGSDLVAEQTRADYTKVGISSSLIQYQSSATDLTATAALAAGDDVIVPTVTDATGCVNLAKALQQLHVTKPVLSNPLCLALPASAYPGGDYPQWTFGIAGANLSDPASPEVSYYLKTAAAYGVTAADATWSYSGIAWGQLLASVKLMDKIGYDKLTNASLGEAWKAFRGPTPLAAPKADCSGSLVPGQPTACQNEAQFVTYEGASKWKSLGWLGPPN